MCWTLPASTPMYKDIPGHNSAYDQPQSLEVLSHTFLTARKTQKGRCQQQTQSGNHELGLRQSIYPNKCSNSEDWPAWVTKAAYEDLCVPLADIHVYLYICINVYNFMLATNTYPKVLKLLRYVHSRKLNILVHLVTCALYICILVR